MADCRNIFHPNTPPDRCVRCGCHVKTQGHKDNCPNRKEGK